MGSHRTAADAEREVGEADGEVPALVERPAAGRLDELALVRCRVGGVGLGVPDVPLDVLIAPAERTEVNRRGYSIKR